MASPNSSSRARQSTSTCSVPSNASQRPRVCLSNMQAQPWRYLGYRHYARFISSTNEFFIVRRFASMNARAILQLQHELVKLETRLRELDDRYEQATPPVHNGSFESDEIDRTDRADLLCQIQEKLYKYSTSSATFAPVASRNKVISAVDLTNVPNYLLEDKVVLQQSAMRRYPAAPKRDIKSIRRWHGNWDNVAIDDHEQAYLKEEEDLICIAQYEKVPLRRLIDSSQALRTLPIWLDKKKQVPDYDAEAVSYYSDARSMRSPRWPLLSWAWSCWLRLSGCFRPWAITRRRKWCP